MISTRSGLSLNLNIQLLSGACCPRVAMERREDAVDAWLGRKRSYWVFFVGESPKINSTVHASGAVCRALACDEEWQRTNVLWVWTRSEERKILLAIIQRFCQKNVVEVKFYVLIWMNELYFWGRTVSFRNFSKSGVG